MYKEIDPSNLGSVLSVKDGVSYLDTSGIYYKNLNAILRHATIPNKIIHLENVYGQRYIGTDINPDLELHIYGTPGNDLAAFLNGNTVIVHGNAQDGVGNTMNRGTVIVHGRAGDIVGHSMRGGEIYIRNNVGYRCGIHMKEYFEQKPTIVVGGTAQDYLGEYMAGGVLVVLGLTLGPTPVHQAKFVGTGMHGGVIYIRGKVSNVGKEVEVGPLKEQDFNRLETAIRAYCKYFDVPPETIAISEFTKLAPLSKRPYGKLYIP
jgi:glutamate synthase domain-containing protein 3